MKTLLHSIGGHGYIRPNGLEARNKASRRAYFTFLSRHHQCLSPSHLSTQRYGKTNLRKIRNEHQEEESIWDYKCTSAQGRASLGSQPQASEEFITTLLTYPERWERVTVKKQKRMKWSSQDFFFFLCLSSKIEVLFKLHLQCPTLRNTAQEYLWILVRTWPIYRNIPILG